MECRKDLVDLVLVPLSFLLSILYHVFLWYRVKNHPLNTVIGINSIGRRLWVKGMIKGGGDKNGVLAVQTVRNSIMGCVLMAVTSIMLGCGLAAMISSTYTIKEPLNNTHFGSHGNFILAIKFSVDGMLVRVFKNSEDLGIAYPKNQAMRIYSSLWNADEWVTRGGAVNINWRKSPFLASYANFKVEA